MAIEKKGKNKADIPNPINALPVRRPGPIIAGIIVGIFALWIIIGLFTNERLEWPVVGKYLFNENVLDGIGWTLILTVIAMVISTIIAIALAVMRGSSNKVLSGVSWFWIWFFRGTPIYTQLVFWGLFAVLVPRLGLPFGPEWLSVNSQTLITPFIAAILGLSLNESAYLAEIVRAGLEAVDRGQTEAAQALGMQKGLMMRRIILPQAMRIIVPPVGNETIGMLKTTSLVLAVPFTLDLQFATNAIANRLYKPIPLLIVASIWYLFITSILMIIQSQLEKHFGKGFEQRVITTSNDEQDSSDENSNYHIDVNKLNQTKWVGLNA